jgi:hypothetical protein
LITQNQPPESLSAAAALNVFINCIYCAIFQYLRRRANHYYEKLKKLLSLLFSPLIFFVVV